MHVYKSIDRSSFSFTACLEEVKVKTRKPQPKPNRPPCFAHPPPLLLLLAANRCALYLRTAYGLYISTRRSGGTKKKKKSRKLGHSELTTGCRKTGTPFFFLIKKNSNVTPQTGKLSKGQR